MSQMDADTDSGPIVFVCGHLPNLRLNSPFVMINPRKLSPNAVRRRMDRADGLWKAIPDGRPAGFALYLG